MEYVVLIRGGGGLFFFFERGWDGGSLFSHVDKTDM